MEPCIIASGNSAVIDDAIIQGSMPTTDADESAVPPKPPSISARQQGESVSVTRATVEARPGNTDDLECRIGQTAMGATIATTDVLTA